MRNPFSKAPLSGAATLLLILTLCVSVFSQTLVFSGRVVNVSNGDTLTVLTKSNSEFQVRCQGVDAPKGQQDFAAESRQRLSDLLLDEAVTFRYDKRDPDGTLVGTILLDGRNICLEQIKLGMASYDDQSDLNRSTHQQYAHAESGARDLQVGMWTAARDTSTSRSESIGRQGLSSSASSSETRGTDVSNGTVSVRGYFRKDGTYVSAYNRSAPQRNFINTGTKRSRWITALKWVGVGATLGALVYLNARYPTLDATYGSPMAVCNDGTYSYSQNRRGTCSHHGGVRRWLR